MSDSPAGHLEDTLPGDVEVGRIETPGMPVHLRLQRVPREDGVRIWKLSAASVAAIPALYTRYGDGLLGAVLPRVFFETEWLDTQLWQWLAFPLLAGLGYGLGLLGTTLGFRLLRSWWSELASVLSTFVTGPVRLLICVLFFSLADGVPFSVTASRVLDTLEQLLLILAITWMILRVAESCEAIVRAYALRRDKTTLLPLLPVVQETVTILIAIFAGGVQWIGWDAAGKHARSWAFLFNGGFAEAVWAKDRNTWKSTLTATIHDGKKMTATNILTKIDANHFSVQFIDRKLDGANPCQTRRPSR